MNLTKKQVIERFCALSTKVMSEQFHYELPADCFCGKNGLQIGGYEFDEEIMKYIESKF